MRRPLVIANWKMHGSQASVDQLLVEMAEAGLAAEVEVAVCPSYVHLAQAVERCTDTDIGVGAQDCSHMRDGAFTGEVAAPMLADLGCQWVLLGHSERRQYHAESDELVAAKLAAAVEAGLQPVLCVGETRDQRESGEAERVVAAQLAGAMAEQTLPANLVVAYEPVWAIGTGLTASPEQAQEMHSFIRGQLAAVGVADPAATRVLYGGSVKAGNAEQLFGQPDIDGALVGGASLDAAEFTRIVAAAVAK